ncbi:MAG: dephospho-CoA kinase [Eubacteriales bacterium]|nr:dephospho-CoA kinase [Eubacteriales bacterium]
MFVLGITGGIGAGKSTVASLCREAGLTVIDADEISRQVTQAGGSALAEIASEFGQKFILPELGLNREKMSKLVFTDKQALDKLGQIVHKKVRETVKKRVKELSEAGVKALVLDFPIPVEEGFLDLSDHVVSVWAERQLRLERLSLRGLAKADAELRMQVQMTREEYREKADEELLNNGSFEDLKQKVQELLERELGGRGINFKKL